MTIANRILDVFLAVAVLIAIGLPAYLLATLDKPGRVPLSAWILLGGISLGAALAFAWSSVLRRRSGLPLDFRFTSVVVLIAVSLGSVAGFSGNWWLTPLVIALLPLVFLLRRRQQPVATSKALLWYPFRSPEAKDIYDHLTPDELGRLSAYAWKAGGSFGVLISLILYPVLFGFMTVLARKLPAPWSFVVLFSLVLPLGLLIGWIGAMPLRKKVTRILSETDHAKRMGLTPATLRLYRWGALSRLLFCLAAVSLLAGGAVALFAAPKPDEPFAILARMAKTYADCPSYEDSGIVTTVFIEERGNRTDERPFTTAFVRPDRFRFEYRDNNGGNREYRYIIWSDTKATPSWWEIIGLSGMDVRTWWDVKPGIEKPQSLDFALGSAVGVSGNSSKTIPALLMPDRVSAGGLTQHLAEATRGEDGTLGTVEWFRIDGKYGDSPITLWIEKKSYLLRRIDGQRKFANFRTEETTTYDPTIGELVTDELLAFNPPTPK
jgi:hypothetical protein